MCPHIYIIHIHLSISTSCGSAWLLHLVPLVTMFGFKRVPWIDIVIIIIDMVNTILITITSLLRYRIMLRDWLDNCCEDCWFSVRKRFSPRERCDGRPEPCKRLPTPSQSPALWHHDTMMMRIVLMMGWWGDEDIEVTVQLRMIMRKMIMMTTTMMVMRKTINVMVIMRKASIALQPWGRSVQCGRPLFQCPAQWSEPVCKWLWWWWWRRGWS